jgi:D-glycero-alpha-D-manno-heptose-7-phosphate kinase
MIISKTPYRISFFGGGSDYEYWYSKYGGEILSSTIDRFVYVSLGELLPFYNHKYRISYRKHEIPKKLSDIKFHVIKSFLKFNKIKLGMDIQYHGELPGGTGVGSSSAFVIGLYNSYYSLLKKKVSPQLLAKKSYHFENKVLNEVGGIQDQIAISYGGLNYFKISKSGNFKIKKVKINQDFKKKLTKSLYLFYSGISRKSAVISSTYNFDKNLFSIKKNMEFALEGKKILESGKNLDEFGNLLNENWKIKKLFTPQMSSSKLDSLYNFALDNGALGGKLLGAGGGGFFLFYVPENKKKLFFKKMTKYGTPLNINFYEKGSQIIENY